MIKYRKAENRAGTFCLSFFNEKGNCFDSKFIMAFSRFDILTTLNKNNAIPENCVRIAISDNEGNHCMDIAL